MDQGKKLRADTDAVVHSGRQLWQQDGIACGALSVLASLFPTQNGVWKQPAQAVCPRHSSDV